ncbi:hypothetical protein PMAYCL1PPCAC_20302, partial [Pristionchus mayeri]
LQILSIVSVMPHSLILASQCTRLHVNLESDQCSINLSEDAKSIIFETTSQDRLSSVEMRLLSNDGTEMISPLLNRFHGNGSIGWMRIDSLYPLIVGENESLELVPEKMRKWLDATSTELKKYSLLIAVLFSPKTEPVQKETTTQIHTIALTVEDDSVLVCRELLALRSPFFETLFYREFAEKVNGVYKLKEINKVDFRSFMENIFEIYRVKDKFLAVEDAIIALTYADRFGLMDIHQEAFAFLKTQTLPKELLKDVFIICSRFNDNEDIIKFLLGQYESENELLNLISDCVPLVSSNATQSALMVLQSVFREQKIKIASLDNKNKQNMEGWVNDANAAKRVLIHLQCCDDKGDLEMESWFTIPFGNYSGNIDWSPDLWLNIPPAFTTATLNEKTRSRNEGVSFANEFSSNQIVRAPPPPPTVATTLSTHVLSPTTAPSSSTPTLITESTKQSFQATEPTSQHPYTIIIIVVVSTFSFCSIMALAVRWFQGRTPSVTPYTHPAPPIVERADTPHNIMDDYQEVKEELAIFGRYVVR